MVFWRNTDNKSDRIFSLVQVNDRVQIVRRGVSCLSRVEDVRPPYLYVGMPICGRQVVHVSKGDMMTVNVFLDTGIWRFFGQVNAVTNDRVPCVVVTDIRDQGKVQRRDYLRVPVELQVHYRRNDGDDSDQEWHEAEARNLSGGGLRVRLQGAEVLHERDFVDVEVHLPGSLPVLAVCRVIRVWEDEGDPQVGLEFVEIGPNGRRAVIQFVQNKQIEESARRRFAA